MILTFTIYFYNMNLYNLCVTFPDEDFGMFVLCGGDVTDLLLGSKDLLITNVRVIRMYGVVFGDGTLKD